MTTEAGADQAHTILFASSPPQLSRCPRATTICAAPWAARCPRWSGGTAAPPRAPAARAPAGPSRTGLHRREGLADGMASPCTDRRTPPLYAARLPPRSPGLASRQSAAAQAATSRCMRGRAIFPRGLPALPPNLPMKSTADRRRGVTPAAPASSAGSSATRCCAAGTRSLERHAVQMPNSSTAVPAGRGGRRCHVPATLQQQRGWRLLACASLGRQQQLLPRHSTARATSFPSHHHQEWPRQPGGVAPTTPHLTSRPSPPGQMRVAGPKSRWAPQRGGALKPAPACRWRGRWCRISAGRDGGKARHKSKRLSLPHVQLSTADRPIRTPLTTVQSVRRQHIIAGCLICAHKMTEASPPAARAPRSPPAGRRSAPPPRRTQTCRQHAAAQAGAVVAASGGGRQCARHKARTPHPKHPTHQLVLGPWPAARPATPRSADASTTPSPGCLAKRGHQERAVCIAGGEEEVQGSLQRLSQLCCQRGVGAAGGEGAGGSGEGL